MNLEEKFSKLIKEDLPGKVGDELKKVLLQAERDAKDLKDLQLEYGKLEKKLVACEKDIDRLTLTLKEHVSLDLKKNALDTRERNLKITELEIKLEEAHKRADIVQEFTSKLVRNTNFRKTVFDSEGTNVPYTDQFGNICQAYVNNTKNYTEESEES
jgi:hypothetical protein